MYLHIRMWTREIMDRAGSLGEQWHGWTAMNGFAARGGRGAWDMVGVYCNIAIASAGHCSVVSRFHLEVLTAFCLLIRPQLFPAQCKRRKPGRTLPLESCVNQFGSQPASVS